MTRQRQIGFGIAGLAVLLAFALGVFFGENFGENDAPMPAVENDAPAPTDE